MTSRPLTPLMAGLLALAAPATRAQEPAQRWTPLFNGKDLAGWKTDPKQRGDWKVANGALVGSGNATSHLFT